MMLGAGSLRCDINSVLSSSLSKSKLLMSWRILGDYKAKTGKQTRYEHRGRRPTATEEPTLNKEGDQNLHPPISKAEELVEEENRLLEAHTNKAVEYITRLLMMSVDKRSPMDKVAHFKEDIGFPFDFRTRWVHMFPEYIRVVKRNDVEFLELTSWNPSWAVTKIEMIAMMGTNYVPESHSPGILSFPFPMKFPPNFEKIFKIGGKIEHFQKRSYMSPYADARELTPSSQEFDKRAVTVMHEILSFTIEKRLVTDHLTRFHWEFVMPQKLMRILLKHYGIFYVSRRGKRFSAFLTEAYKGSELIDKSPLYLWKEKILRLTSYRGRRKRISDDEKYILFDNDHDTKPSFLKIRDEEDVGTLEDASLRILRWIMEMCLRNTRILDAI